MSSERVVPTSPQGCPGVGQCPRLRGCPAEVAPLFSLSRQASGPDPCGSELPLPPVSWAPLLLLGAAEPLWPHSWLRTGSPLCLPMQAAQMDLYSLHFLHALLLGPGEDPHYWPGGGLPLLTSFSISARTPGTPKIG